MSNGKVEDRTSWEAAKRHSSPFVPIIISVVAAIVWLAFILLYALFWSKSFDLFQNLVVFVATLFITALVIGLTWLVWGRNQWNWWSR